MIVHDHAEVPGEVAHLTRIGDHDTEIIGETQDWKFLVNVLREKKITAVIHFSAYIEMGESMKEPQKYFFNNLYGSMCLFKAMLTAGVKKLVFSFKPILGKCISSH